MILNFNNLDGEEKAFLCEIVNRKKTTSIEANFDILSIFKTETIQSCVSQCIPELTEEGKVYLNNLLEKIKT